VVWIDVADACCQDAGRVAFVGTEERAPRPVVVEEGIVYVVRFKLRRRRAWNPRAPIRLQSKEYPAPIESRHCHGGLAAVHHL